MSAGPAALPRSAWLAVGVATSAAGIAIGLPVAAMLFAGLVALAVGSAGLRLLPGPRGVAVTAVGVGAVLLALRVLAGPVAAPTSQLSTAAAGPWRAVVESVGSPRNGSQVAWLRLSLATGTVLVTATLPSYPTVAAGTDVEVDGRLSPPPDDDPYGEYLRRAGAAGSLRASRLRVIGMPAGASLQASRDAAGDALRATLPEPEAGLAAGILIGLRERVDRDLAADFATAGVSHVVAISGWNIAIVAGLVGAVMRGRPRRLAAIVVGGTITAYVIAAGASPSVVRAGVMAAVVLAARESGRAGRAAAALGLAAAILLLVDPEMFEDAGFRLSVMATAGLLAWATPLGSWIGGLGGGRVPGWLAESLGISLAAQAATLPDVLATFGRLSLVSPMVNLLVVPLVPVAMAGGILAMAAGGLVALGAPPMLGVVAGLPGWLALHLIVAIVRSAAGLPFAAVTLEPGLATAAAVATAAGVLVTPMILRRVWRRRSPRSARRGPPSRSSRSEGSAPRPARVRRAAVVAAAFIVGISSVAVGDAANRDTRLVMLDIGQGDAILLETRGGGRMLVDGGPDPERLLVQLDARVPPWDRRIDIVVLTHPHEDHVAGLVRVLERFRVGRVYEPGMRGPGPGWAAWDAALRDGPARALLAAGAQIHLDEILLTVLWPEPGAVPLESADSGRAINSASIVLLGEVVGRRFLLTGDAEDDVDPALLARGLPHLDVLKVAHHGSATATSAALLEATRPEVALISVGTGNSFGHPTAAALTRLRDSGARVYRTDRDGTIEVTLRQTGATVRTSGARPTKASPSPRSGNGRIADPLVALASANGYDPPDDHPLPFRGGSDAALPGAARVVPSPRLRGRGRRGLARAARGGERPTGRPLARGGSRAHARRRQAVRCRGPDGHPAR